MEPRFESRSIIGNVKYRVRRTEIVFMSNDNLLIYANNLLAMSALTFNMFRPGMIRRSPYCQSRSYPGSVAFSNVCGYDVHLRRIRVDRGLSKTSL